MCADVAANGGDQRRQTAEGASTDTLACDLGEKALNEIEPRGAGRGEVKMNPRMLGEPCLHRGMLVGAVIVDLCGAPHKSIYGERAVMWSAAALPQEAPAFSHA
jgi:hypothetical protein